MAQLDFIYGLARLLLFMPKSSSATMLIPIERVERSILMIRGRKVMLDSDLAQLYGVLTERLNEQVRRNLERFPSDFAFYLTHEEYLRLIPQIAGSKAARGGRRKLPLVFTEHGALMAANVLKSSVAIQASIHVVRAFSRLRELLASHHDLARKLQSLERKYDERFLVVFKELRKLMTPPPVPERPPIGFGRP